ncbi:hypothetical protein LB559_28145 [Mesorhizobium sp. BR1-1-3]|uniref:hypothetical protein n=1 Tax=Mesorhizobium sp. BR1-1-3 TaxID=2876651 RepID=UPI001CD0ECDC|nr:hypothetical protein [Mesorhizobium sp. BR1-1-3]MBZ9891802.1 hypothetical protein [Mesorhizobium sp. BR1-1-3]
MMLTIGWFPAQLALKKRARRWRSRHGRAARTLAVAFAGFVGSISLEKSWSSGAARVGQWIFPAALPRRSGAAVGITVGLGKL